MAQNEETAAIICNPEKLRDTNLIKDVWNSLEKDFTFLYIYTEKEDITRSLKDFKTLGSKTTILNSEEDLEQTVSNLKNSQKLVSIFYLKDDTQFNTYIQENYKDKYNCDIKIITISENNKLDFDSPEWLNADTSKDINDNIKYLQENCYKINKKFCLYADHELLENLKVMVTLKKPIFVYGERGSGKTTTIEHAVKALLNIKADKKFVSVACGTLVENLAKSELFGHVKGAFTGAIDEKEGFVQAANGGCLYLDEIQDLSKEVQRMLIKGIENHTFYKVGTTESYPSNFLLICSSNRPLNELKDLLWEDFYDRISTFQIKIPSIEEQKEKNKNFISECLPNIWENYKNKCSTPQFFDSYSKLDPQTSGKIIFALNNNTLRGNFRDIEKLLAYIELYALNTIVKNIKGEDDKKAINKNIDTAISEWKFLIGERNSHLPDAIPSQLTDDFIKKQNWKALNRMFKTWLAEQAVRIYGSEYKAAKNLHVDKNTIHNNLPENQNDMIETED